MQFSFVQQYRGVLFSIQDEEMLIRIKMTITIDFWIYLREFHVFSFQIQPTMGEFHGVLRQKVLSAQPFKPEYDDWRLRLFETQCDSIRQWRDNFRSQIAGCNTNVILIVR